MIVCAGRNEIISCATPIGVGLVESSIGLTRLCMREYVESLIFIGSAGAYSHDLPLLSICVSSRATQIESSLIAGGSYTPLDNAIELESELKDVSRETLQQVCGDLSAKAGSGLHGKLGGDSHGDITNVRDVVVNSSNYITTDSAIAEQMAGAGIAIENMEFFSVLAVAREFGLPAVGVFCITNYCDKNARADFLRNHDKAKEMLAKFVADFTNRGERAQGERESDWADGVRNA